MLQITRLFNLQYGFFSRKIYNQLKDTQNLDNNGPSSSNELASIEKSTEDLLIDDSDSGD